jgi:hypothetical protein
MLNDSDDATVVAAAPRRTSKATKLLQAAALAAVLVPLGTVAVETATINCVTTSSGGGCFNSAGGSGFFYSGGGQQSNTWSFYRNANTLPQDLIYSFTITGTPAVDFSLNVRDFVTTQAALSAAPPGEYDVQPPFPLMNFAGLMCVPTNNPGLCGLFDVTSDGTPAWSGLFYDAKIAWNTNADPASLPASNRVTILQAKDYLPDGSPNWNYVFTNTLSNIWYDPNQPPPDPGIGGRGNSFSRFGVFWSEDLPPAGNQSDVVPEPGSMILLGTGLAGAIHRARRRKRQF